MFVKCAKLFSVFKIRVRDIYKPLPSIMYSFRSSIIIGFRNMLYKRPMVISPLILAVRWTSTSKSSSILIFRLESPVFLPSSPAWVSVGLRWLNAFPGLPLSGLRPVGNGSFATSGAFWVLQYSQISIYLYLKLWMVSKF